MKSAEQRRSAGLEDRVRRARKLGDYEVKERRKALKLEKGEGKDSSLTLEELDAKKAKKVWKDLKHRGADKATVKQAKANYKAARTRAMAAAKIEQKANEAGKLQSSPSPQVEMVSMNSHVDTSASRSPMTNVENPLIHPTRQSRLQSMKSSSVSTFI